MMDIRLIIRIFGTGIWILCLGLPCLAQGTADSPPTVVDGFSSDYLLELDKVEARILLVARELPEKAYSISSGNEVHTVAECLNSTSAITREALISLKVLKRSSMGPPAVGKESIVQELETILNELRQAAMEIDAKGLERPIDYMGRRWTARGLFLFALTRQAEGLGHVALHSEVLGYPPRWIREKRASKLHDD